MLSLAAVPLTHRGISATMGASEDRRDVKQFEVCVSNEAFTPSGFPFLTSAARMNDEPNQSHPSPSPLSRDARRVLGVLVEKAKTTPDQYPLTLAALIAGCNQKSNRAPQLQLDEGDVLLALDQLREVGAAREVQGSGRATKYRHAAYDWLEVDSPQAAVMTELLLRGPQTAGELRTRASRMYALENVQAAQAVIDSLVEKGLVEPLTPPGRGQTFAHTLYPPEERQHLEAKVEKRAAAAPEAAPAPQTGSAPSDQAVEQIIARLDAMNEKLQALEQRLDALES